MKKLIFRQTVGDKYHFTMIKTALSFLILCFIFLSDNGFAQDLKNIRNQYHAAVTDENVCRALIAKLSKEKEIGNIELAYLGALETIWAKYVLNPFSKLKTFKNGKEKIEQAVNQEPNNIEIRYLRLSIQKNVPGFLGYNDNIKEDDLFLKTNLNNVVSEQLRTMIENILKG